MKVIPPFGSKAHHALQLHKAILAQHHEVIDDLLKRTTQIDGYTLFCAVLVGDDDLVRKLINRERELTTDACNEPRLSSSDSSIEMPSREFESSCFFSKHCANTSLSSGDDSVVEIYDDECCIGEAHESLINIDNREFYFEYELFKLDVGDWLSPKDAILATPLVLSNRGNICQMLFNGGYYSDFINELSEYRYNILQIIALINLMGCKGAPVNEDEIDDSFDDWQCYPYDSESDEVWWTLREYEGYVLENFLIYSQIKYIDISSIECMISNDRYNLIRVIIENENVDFDKSEVLLDLFDELDDDYGTHYYEEIIELCTILVSGVIETHDGNGSAILVKAIEIGDEQIIQRLLENTTNLVFEDYIQPIDTAISRNQINAALIMLNKLPILTIHHVRYMIDVANILENNYPWFIQNCECIYNRCLRILIEDIHGYLDVPYDLLMVALRAKWNAVVIRLVENYYFDINSKYLVQNPLEVALQTQNWNIADLMLGHGYQVDNERTHNTIMSLVIGDAPDNILCSLLKKSGNPTGLINAGNPNAVQLVISHRDENKAGILLEYTPDVNVIFCGHILLTIALLEQWNDNVIATLISNTRLIDHQSPDGTPVTIAARLGMLDQVKLLISTSNDTNKIAAMEEAILFGQDDVAHFIKSTGVKFSNIDDTMRMVEIAISQRLLKTCKSFLSELLHGENLIQVEKLLYLSIKYKFNLFTKIILSNQVDITKTDDDGITLLVFTVLCENYWATRLLVNHLSANFEVGSDNYKMILDHLTNIGSALTLSIDRELKHITKLLIKSGSNMNICFNGISPLCKAVSNNWTDVSKEMIDHGASVDDASLSKLLNMAAQNNDLPVVRLCLKYGVSASSSVDYHSLLKETCKTGDMRYKILELLFTKLKEACDDVVDGLTPLSRTLIAGHEKLSCILINKGANIEHINPAPRKNQILLALKNRICGAAALMIKKGVNVHCKNDDGENTLMLAINIGNVKLIRSILKKGVSPLEKNNDGMNAYAYAGNNSIVVELLHKHKDVST